MMLLAILATALAIFLTGACCERFLERHESGHDPP